MGHPATRDAFFIWNNIFCSFFYKMIFMRVLFVFWKNNVMNKLFGFGQMSGRYAAIS